MGDGSFHTHVDLEASAGGGTCGRGGRVGGRGLEEGGGDDVKGNL